MASFAAFAPRSTPKHRNDDPLDRRENLVVQTGSERSGGTRKRKFTAFVKW